MSYKVGDMVKLHTGLEDGKNQMKFCGYKRIKQIEHTPCRKFYILDGVSGYRFTESMLEPAEEKATESMSEPAEEKKPPKRLISIVVEGNKVTAIEGHLKGVARCSPEDKFNLAEGVKLAIERLENPWPRNGDEYYAACGAVGNLYAGQFVYDGSIDCNVMRKNGKLCFRKKKQAQDFIDRLNEFIKRDRGVE